MLLPPQPAPWFLSQNPEWGPKYGPRIAMQRAQEGRAAPGLAVGAGLEPSVLQIASGSHWDGPACSSSDSTTECKCPGLKQIIASIGTSKPGSATSSTRGLTTSFAKLCQDYFTLAVKNMGLLSCLIFLGFQLWDAVLHLRAPKRTLKYQIFSPLVHLWNRPDSL